jgi:hypothetical protein
LAVVITVQGTFQPGKRHEKKQKKRDDFAMALAWSDLLNFPN